MENLYDPWSAGSSTTNNSNSDFLNSSQNEKSWLNSSLNLPPELRFNALNELVSKIVDDRPNNATAELSADSNKFKSNANTEAQYFWQHGIEASAAAAVEKRQYFAAQISNSSITSVKHESSLSPASSSSSFSLPTNGSASKTPNTPLSADNLKHKLSPSSQNSSTQAAVFANSPTNAFNYDLQSPTSKQYQAQQMKYDSSQMVKVCQNQMNTPTMVSLNEFRRMIGLRDTKPLPQQQQVYTNPHSAPFTPQQFDQNQLYYNTNKNPVLCRPSNFNMSSNCIPNIPTKFSNSPRPITNNLDNKLPQHYPTGNMYAYASPVQPQFYIQTNLQPFSADSVKQASISHEEQLNAYYKMQQHAAFNAYDGAANFMQRQAAVNRSGLDALADIHHAQNNIVLPHLLNSLDDAKKTGPSNELHVRLEECLYQFKSLENERKKIELELIRLFPDGKFNNALHFPSLRLPANPSRVDRLINEVIREHFKVSSVILKMQELSGSAIHPNIKIAVDKWYGSILSVQSRRRDEIINASTRQKLGQPRINDERDVILLSNSIKDLTLTTCRMRTSLWCSYQMATNFQADISNDNEMKSAELSNLLVKQFADNSFSLNCYQNQLKKSFDNEMSMKPFAEYDINNNSNNNHIELTPTLIQN